jgi:hypothetical protein
MTNYTREQWRQLYLKLPLEIKEMASADETTDLIFKVLEANDLTDERGTKISDLIRRVLYGLLLPSDFQESLEKEVKLKKETAKKVAAEINRFVFFPIRESLNKLYQMPSASSDETMIRPSKADSYREPIE